MNVEQFVMAYEAEQDRLRAMLPEGFVSLRPVLRINAEIRDCETVWVEFNTPAEKDDVRGWVNIGCWNNASYERDGRKVIFRTDLLEISECIMAVQTQKYNCAMITFRSAEKIRVYADPLMPWTLDGEREDGHTSVDVENLHHAIRLMQKVKKDA